MQYKKTSVSGRVAREGSCLQLSCLILLQAAAVAVVVVAVVVVMTGVLLAVEKRKSTTTKSIGHLTVPSIDSLPLQVLWALS